MAFSHHTQRLMRGLGKFLRPQKDATNNPIDEVTAIQEPIIEYAAPVQKSPVATPRAAQKTKPHPAKPIAPASLFDAFPEDTNIIDRKPADITVDGKHHFITVRRDRMNIDGKDFTMTKGSDEKEFDAVMRHGKILVMKIAGMRDITLDETELQVLLTDLVIRGTFEDDNTGLVISRF